MHFHLQSFVIAVDSTDVYFVHAARQKLFWFMCLRSARDLWRRIKGTVVWKKVLV